MEGAGNFMRTERSTCASTFGPAGVLAFSIAVLIDSSVTLAKGAAFWY